MAGTSSQLEPHEYETLCGATRTHREELLVRLSGEAGLRAGEIARLRPADLASDEGAESRGYFLTVREADGGTRIGYLPSNVAHRVQQYVRSNSIGAEAELIDVTERRIQMIVTELCERVAEGTGRAVFEGVTPSTLRTFFAQQLLVEDGVDARVVAAVGGWEGVDDLLAGLEEPTRAEIAVAFEQLETEDDDSTGRLPLLVDTVETVLQQVTDADSRESLERRACEGLTDSYRAAWVLEWGPRRERLQVRTHAGETPDRFDGAGETGIVRRSLQTGQPLVAPDDPGPAANQEGRGLLAAVPLVSGDTQYGALVVRAGSRDAFDDPERSTLAMLGRQLGFAIDAIERKQVLLGGAVLAVTFQYGGQSTLVRLADTLSCSLVLEGAVAGDDGVLCFVRAAETEPKPALEAAADLPGISDTRLIRSTAAGGVLELDLREDSPLLSLADRGARVSELRIENGQATLTCELPPETSVRTLHDDLHEQFPSLELHSKQKREATRETLDTRGVLDEELTEKQRAVIQAAYHAGYFEWPRESTAEDLADSMDVSPPTLHNHLRKAQQNLLDSVLEN
jgi:DNA-binding transcriptional ArsR family regulator